MKRGIQVKFTFIEDIIKSLGINKVINIVNKKEVDDREVTEILASVTEILRVVTLNYCDEFDLFVSLKDEKAYIGVNRYGRFRAFRDYIHKWYTVESFSKKNHMVTKELETLAELMFGGCLPSALSMSVNVPTATVTIYVSDSVKKNIRDDFGVFNDFITKYEDAEDKKIEDEQNKLKTEYIKDLKNYTTNIDIFFNDLNNILKMIPKHSRIVEEYILALNMSLKSVFDENVFISKRFNNNIKYELHHYKFDNIFKNDKAFEFIDERHINKYIELLLQTNNIGSIIVDENHKLVMPNGTKTIYNLGISVTNLVELVRTMVMNKAFTDCNKEETKPELTLTKENMDISFIKTKIKGYEKTISTSKDTYEINTLKLNYAVSLINEYNARYGTDFVMDTDGKLISHEGALLAPIVDKYITAVRDFDFKIIDECVSEIPECFKFTSVRTDNKIIVKYGRGVF